MARRPIEEILKELDEHAKELEAIMRRVREGRLELSDIDVIEIQTEYRAIAKFLVEYKVWPDWAVMNV